MSDRLHTLDDERFGAALARLGDELAWPATPDLASAVGEAIREERKAPSVVALRLSMPSRRRTLLVIAAAVLTLAATALAARLVIELGAVEIEVVPGPPTALPTDVGAGDDLGREIRLSDAEGIAGFPPALPIALGPPDRAWVDEAQVGFEPEDVTVRIVTSWAPSTDLPEIPGTGAGAVLIQFEGEWEVASKQLSAETNRYSEAIVGGRPAFWTTGEHELLIVSGDETQRFLVSGNVLIWEADGFTFRLETALPKQRSIAIAETVTTGP